MDASSLQVGRKRVGRNQNGVMAEYKFRGIDMEGAMLLDDENGNAADSEQGKCVFYS